MTDYLNDYFVSVGKNLADKCTFDNKDYLTNCKISKSLSYLNSWDRESEVEMEVIVRYDGFIYKLKY